LYAAYSKKKNGGKSLVRSPHTPYRVCEGCVHGFMLADVGGAMSSDPTPVAFLAAV
jgi:hypothetical protein